jgi:peroxiredoxin
MTTSPPRLPALDFERIGPAVGTPFPDVRLPDQTGQLVDLHRERAGRRALVVFYRSARW